MGYVNSNMQVGHMKGEALKRRILDINPEAQVTVALDFMRPNNVDQYILSSEDDAGNGGFNPSLPEDDIPDRKIGTPRFDFVVDAADGVSDKAAIIDACVRSGTPVVVCGGAGGTVVEILIIKDQLSVLLW
jgi:tRNA A37 threonylcarbamoyladenosine dehydratase